MDLRGLRVESFQCRNHPEREGVGICVACRRVFCVECSTKIDGVNHCTECLAKRQLTAQASTSRRSGLVVRFLELALSVAVAGGSLVLVFAVFAVMGESARGGTRRVANRDRMESVARALRSYKRDTGAFPTAKEGLAALARRPSSATGWQGPYVEMASADAKGEPLDAFSMPILYRPPRAGETACLVGSGGGDRRLETDLDTVDRNKSAGNEAMGQGDDVIIFVD